MSRNEINSSIGQPSLERPVRFLAKFTLTLPSKLSLYIIRVIVNQWIQKYRWRQ